MVDDDEMIALRRLMPEDTNNRMVAHTFAMHFDRARLGLAMGETQAEMGRRIIGEGGSVADAFLVVKAAWVMDRAARV